MGEFRQPITTSLAQRQRLVKMFKDYSIRKRVDFSPSTMLGWMEAKGYLNIDAIIKDLDEEKKTLNDMEEKNNDI